MVSVKRRKRRVINISRKFQAELSNGILKFFPKKKIGIASEPEFQIDLAKATVMYDEKRIVLILK
ncbi:50S ribosomal protein L22 domain protein, partial [Ostertagia ostertagi]